MILCVDVGNTNIKCGIYYEKKLQSFFVIDTNKERSSFQYKVLFEQFLKDFKITGAIISSVVPLLTNIIKNSLINIVEGEIFILNRNLKTKLPIKIDNPNELGADLLAGSIGAINKYSYPLIVADLGTATKLYVVSKEGAFIGCVITAGMDASLKALINKTSQLMEVSIEAPQHILGKNTKTSMQSGIVYGQAYMISEFARRIEKELGYSLNRVLTGGFSSIIKNEVICFNFEPYLVLDGLFNIYQMNIGR